MIELDLGIMADSIEQQLLLQGFEIRERELRRLNKIKDSIYMLSLHGYITEDQKGRLLHKFMDELLGEVERLDMAVTSMNISNKSRNNR